MGRVQDRAVCQPRGPQAGLCVFGAVTEARLPPGTRASYTPWLTVEVSLGSAPWAHSENCFSAHGEKQFSNFPAHGEIPGHGARAPTQAFPRSGSLLL